MGLVALRPDTDRAAATLGLGYFMVCERFRRLTLRSATGFSQSEKLRQT
jgi:hypothetical protein